ncbi:MAG TPA: hypothetical protein PKW57_05560 [Anaerolineaceae bacterium]|nr:hypothetical protein [Anaerolineaceae bacterium]
MKTAPCRFLLIVIFLAALLLPLVLADKVGGALSPTENRNLARFPQILTQEKKIAPGIKIGFEAWLKDNLFGRMEAQKARAYIDFRVLRTSPSKLVQIGENGWYFYNNDQNLEIGRGAKLLSPEELEAIRMNQLAIQKALKAQGIEYILVFIPSKASVYPEYMQGGKYRVGLTLIDQVTAYLQQNTTIPVINLKPDLLAAKAEQDVYFRSDTHWNQAGAYIGYRGVINRLNEWKMIQSQPVSISTEPALHTGEFSYIMGFPGLISPEPIRATIIQNPKASLVSSSDKTELVSRLLAETGIKGEYFSYTNPDAERRALILGDSFFFTWKIPDLFAENFAEMNFIRTDVLTSDIIQAVNPDIVIMERAERYIYNLANSSNVNLLMPRLSNPSAEIISHDTPTTIERDKSYDVNIVVKNTGDEAWSEEKHVRLGIFQDGKDYGYRIYLPEGVTVEPGQEYTFVLSNFRAPEGNTTYLEYQMLQEAYQYFGEKERVDLVIK